MFNCCFNITRNSRLCLFSPCRVVYFVHRCSLRIILMMQSTVVTCTGSALARPMCRTERETLTKRRLTSSSRDITLKLSHPAAHIHIQSSAEAKLQQLDDNNERKQTYTHHLASCYPQALLTVNSRIWSKISQLSSGWLC